MMLVEQTTPLASALPIREFADHLRLGSGFSDDGSEDTVLELYLRSALAGIEARIGKALIQRTFSWQISRWFAQDEQALPISPVQVINSVTVIDADDNSTAIDPSEYGLVTDVQRSKLRANGGNLPSIPRGGIADIDFDAGFGPWAAIPAALKQAVFLLAAHYYENRSGEAGAVDLPSGVAVLIESFRPIRIGGMR